MCAIPGSNTRISPLLQTEFCGLTLRSPLVLTSGILGTTANQLARVAIAGAGAVTAKSAGPISRTGHDNPIVFDWGQGLINAVGLPSPGASQVAEMLIEAREALEEQNTLLFASIYAGTPEEFAEVAETILRARPHVLELNISCPNVHDDFGMPFAATCASAVSVVEAVRPVCDVPLFAKLIPNVPNIGQIAADVIAAGADGITAVNAVPGMVIDVESGRPLLTNKSGGLSGPAIKPAAIKCIYEIARAVPGVPIIGVGGVTTARDAVEMIMAGATAVGIGSAIYYRGLEVFSQLNAGLASFMDSHNYGHIAALRGLAHQTSPHSIVVPEAVS